MFVGCEFLMGQEDSMVIVLPGLLPAGADNYTISASPTEIRIKAGFNEIARFPYNSARVFQLLCGKTQVGIVEYPPKEAFPNCITAVAYVETRH